MEIARLVQIWNKNKTVQCNLISTQIWTNFQWLWNAAWVIYHGCTAVGSN